MRRCAAIQKNCSSFLIYTDRIQRTWVRIDIRECCNGGRNIKPDQATFTDKGSLSRDSAFNVAAWGVRKGSNSLVDWLAETWTKRLPTVSKLEMPDLFWFNVVKGIQRLGRLEWQSGFIIEDLFNHTGRVKNIYLSPLLWEMNLCGEPQHPWRALWLLFSVSQTLQWEVQPQYWEFYI